VIPAPADDNPLAAGTAPGGGVGGEEQYEDYFGFDTTEVYTLPDGKQQIFFKVMNEGQKVKFQQKTNRDIHVNRASNDMRIKADPAGERQALIESSVTGWTLKKKVGGQWVDAPFSNNGSPGDELHKWLAVANPRIVEELEDAIRKANPWLQADMTVEQIDEEIQRLHDLRAEVVAKNEKDAAFQA
jgi:hypothetical protein